MGWALIKAVSLAYLLGAVSLSLAGICWLLLRRTLAPQTRAGIGFCALTCASLLSLGMSLVIAAGVVNHSILMTTPYFHSLMGGGGGLSITITGAAVLLLSLALLLRSIIQTRLPRPSEESEHFGGLLLRSNAGVACASLAGVWHPELWVNPRYWAGLSSAEREMVMHHERQHLLRRDNLRKVVLQFVAGMYFAFPWIRAWPPNYELDSELAVDDICRTELAEAEYRALILRTVDAVSASMLPTVTSALTHADLALRLRVLFAPRVPANSVNGAVAAILPIAASAAPPALMLLNPVTRCFFACYLGY